MYHRTGTGSVDAKREAFPSFAGLGGLDIKCFQEMYLDASTLNSPSISPASTDLSTTSLSPVEPSAFGSNPFLATEKQCNTTDAQSQLQQEQRNCSNLLGISASTLLTNSSYLQQKQQQYNSQLFLQQQQQQYSNQLLLQQQKQQQQQIAAALVAQQQQQQQQKNEISQSLKTFAMLSAYKSGSDIYQPTPQSPVEAIMQDFASNGYVSDDVNLYQQQHESLMNFHHSQINSPCYNMANNMNSGNNTLHNLSNLLNSNNTISAMNNQQQAFNANYTEMRKNFWMLHLPPQQYFPNVPQLSPTAPTRAAVAAAAAAAAATAAAAANIDYNSSKNNSGSCSSSSSGSASGGSVGNNKRPQRRFGANKTDKFSAVKHCVFCENNNEPEAVVKSHAVRDSLGRVLCPKLRTYICPICKASGDMAHTVKYCPQKPVITMEDAIKAESFRLAKSNYYKQQMKV